ncbi:MAG: TSUP family transporter [Clostridiales bacterium]|nr:TSUP family transporter [Clostridiales bacterium]
MLILDISVGLVAAVLSGLGVGSGGLIVIYLTMYHNIQQQQAQGINLLFFIAAASSALLVHRKKRKINYGILLILIISGLLSSLFGSYVAGITDSSVIRTCFGILLITSGTLTLLHSFCRKKKQHGE